MFENCKCVEDVKAEYRKMALENHPDRGGSTEAMQKINAAYEAAFGRWKETHRSHTYDASKPEGDRNREYYTKETTEKPEDFINIISALLRLNGLTVELMGRWLWITGDTRKHKDALKTLQCRYCPQKQAWNWHFAGDVSHSRKNHTMDEIREMYGSTTFREAEQLTA